MKNNYIKQIESLNNEYLDIINSNEYIKYKNFKLTKKKLMRLEIISLLTKIIKKVKTRKLNKFNYHQVHYNEKKDYEKCKIVIYTCMTGNYDNIKSPLIKFDNVDYIAFVDELIDVEGWNVKKIPKNIANKIKGNVEKNRYIKMHPFELFHDKYDYSIYIDSNILAVGDLRELIRNIKDKTGLAIHNHRNRTDIYDEIDFCLTYNKGNKKMLKKAKLDLKKEKYPKNFGIYECNVLVTDLSNNIANEIYNDWWNDFINRRAYRDQLSLPYIIWKKNYEFDDVGIISNNVYKNPKLRIYTHVK